MILTKKHIEYYFKNVLNAKYEMFDKFSDITNCKLFYIFHSKISLNSILTGSLKDKPIKLSTYQGYRDHITKREKIIRYFKIKEILE